MQCFLHRDPVRRPRVSNKMVVTSHALKQHEVHNAVSLSATDRVHATNPVAGGKAIEAQLCMPLHHPEAFLVHFMKEICPRGNNKAVSLYFLIHDKGSC